MMNNDVEIKVVLDKTSQFRRDARDAARKAVTKSVLDTISKAQTVVPVDTGYLKNSIQADLSNINDSDVVEGRVTVGAEYGIYVEFGTRYMPARPYLIPAAEEVGEAFATVVKALFKS